MARAFVCCNFVEKLGREISVILLRFNCRVLYSYKQHSQDLIDVSQSGYTVGHMTEEYWFDSRKFCKRPHEVWGVGGPNPTL